VDVDDAGVLLNTVHDYNIMTMANSWKMMQLHIFRVRRLAVQYLAVRRVRRGIAVLVILLFGAIIYSQLQYQKSPTSAIGCKSKIAQVRTHCVLISS